MIKENIEEILGFDGTLSQKLEGFEYRPQQIEMAQAVRKLLIEPSILLSKPEQALEKV